MALVDTAPGQARLDRTDWRPWLALGVAVLSATAYVLVLVVPWLAAGAPDPSALSYTGDPQAVYPTFLTPLLTPLFFWALGVAPFASVSVAGWSVHRLWTTRTVSGGRSLVWTALLLAVATFAWFVVQGAELLIWMID